ncbi:MAG: hypothetical protein ACXVXP_06795, partial [Mycobacteriaceae bacterium]
MGESADKPQGRESALSVGSIVARVAALGLFSYLPLRALQEGFYLEFNVTGSDVGLDETTVLTRAAVLGGFLAGLFSTILIPGGFFGRKWRQKLSPFPAFVRVLVVGLVAAVPWLMYLFLSLVDSSSTTGAVMPANEAFRMEWLFVPIATAVAVGLFYEDATSALRKVSSAPTFFVMLIGILVLALVSAIALAIGSQIGHDARRSQLPSLATELLLSQPISEVSIERLSTASTAS